MRGVQPIDGERRMAAILAADVVGYSRLMGADETGTLARLKAHRRELVDPTVAACHGRIVKLMGDGELVEFASVVDALRCAATVQRGMAERNAGIPAAERIELRIGINLGDVIVDGDDLYGDGVNIAARLEALAEPGGICVSGAVLDQVLHKLDLGFLDLGPRRLKNIADPVRVYRVLLEPAAAGRIVRAPPPWRRRLIAAAVVLVLLVAGGVGALRIWPRPATTPSVVVLPFDNLSDDPGQEYFADGITEDLITDLAKIGGLVVIARNSAFAYKGRPVDPAAVARELGVRYLVEGSVRRVGDRVRVNAQLIDSETGGHLWAERFDRDTVDLFAVQDEVLRHIVAALSVQLTASEAGRLERPPTTSLEAYDWFLRAEQAAVSGDLSAWRPALGLYEKAIALDPGFARAYAARADLALRIWRYGYAFAMPGPLARKLAYEWAGKALELDPGDPTPHSVLAELQLLDRAYDEALASARRAVAAAPGDAAAWVTLASVLTWSGRHAEAAEAATTALRRDPGLASADRIVVGLAFLLAGDTERALRAVEVETMAPAGDERALLAVILDRAGRGDAAAAQLDALRRELTDANLGFYRALFAHFRRDEDLRLVLGSLGRLGVPEWPYGFEGDPDAALRGEAIADLALGRVWQGTIQGVPALLQIGADGHTAFRSPAGIATGRAFVEDDMLCEQSEAVALGRPLCGPVYRLASGDGDATHVYVNGNMALRFRVAP